MSALRAILFDLGDTIIQYGPIDKRALFRQAAQRTYNLWAQRQRRMPGYRRYYLHQWFAMYWGLFKQMLLRREMDAQRYIERACRKLWLEGNHAFFRQLMHTWYSPLKEVGTIEPGTRSMLRQLHRMGYKLGLVSNTFVPGHVLDAHLEQLGLLRFFPHRIYSCDVRYRKPDRRIFQLALDAVGVAANEAVFIGDNLHADVYGARRAGLLSIWKRPPHVTAIPPTSLDAPRIDRLTDLPPLLEQLGQPPA